MEVSGYCTWRAFSDSLREQCNPLSKSDANVLANLTLSLAGSYIQSSLSLSIGLRGSSRELNALALVKQRKGTPTKDHPKQSWHRTEGVQPRSVFKGLLIKPGRLARPVFDDKRRKDAIQRRLEFLVPVLENLPYPFYVIDASDYVICLTNSAHACRGELTATTTCHALLHQRDKPCALEGYPCPVEKVKETKKPFRVEHSHHDSESGKDRIVEIHAFPIFKRGNVSQIVEHCVDITERRQAEAALKGSEPKLVELSNELLETNKALGVMARNFERSREEVEKAVAGAINSKIGPIIRNLQNDRRLEGCLTELGMVATYLNDIVSNLTKGMGIIGPLTSTETKVALMTKNGIKSLEIANHLNISLETVKTHRKNIRKKLGIQNSNLNLFTYLSGQLPAHDEPIVK